MSQILFEQYKDALRRGHVAALQGKLEAAVSAYGAAAAIAPDRALPYVSLADVLHRLGRDEESEVAYGSALQRAPADESALRGRAALRIELGSSLGAARDLEALTEVLERDGRVAEACDAARRALELAESRARRRTVERLVDRLREQETDPDASEAVRLASRLLEPVGKRKRSDASAGAGDGSNPDPALAPIVPLDPAAALRDAEALLEAGDLVAARSLLLAIAGAQRTAGHLDAALDACLILMTINPSDATVQLEIAANQIARGWTAIAAEKVQLLARLATLDADTAVSAAITAFSTEHRLGLNVSAPRPGSGPAG